MNVSIYIYIKLTHTFIRTHAQYTQAYHTVYMREEVVTQPPHQPGGAAAAHLPHHTSAQYTYTRNNPHLQPSPSLCSFVSISISYVPNIPVKITPWKKVSNM